MGKLDQVKRANEEEHAVTITAIVPATDRPPSVDRCAEAIRAATEPPEELVVVRDSRELGPAAARNHGAQLARGDLLVFVDADVRVHPDAFVRLRQKFGGDPSLTALFGSYDAEPVADGTVAQFRNLLHHHIHQSNAGEATTFWAGLGAVRRDAFGAIGGFDAERFPEASIEDIELGMRLVEDGGRIVLDPSILGTHLKVWTLGQMVRTDLFRRGIPWVTLLLRRRKLSAALNLGWRHRLSAAAAVGVVAAALRRQPARAGCCTLALVALNRSFYSLLWRRLGPRAACLGVALHVLHHLTGVAAVPLAMVTYAGEVSESRRRSATSSR